MRIVAVSPDKSLLRDMAWLLAAVGYRVETSTDLGEGAVWRQFALPDVLLIDTRGEHLDPTIHLQSEAGDDCYKIVLFDARSEEDLANWFAAGAHDALRVPISRGELIERVRQGARFLTLQEKLSHRAHSTFGPGWLGESAFLAELARREGKVAGINEGSTLLVTQIDWFDDYQRQAGHAAARRLANSAARSLRRTLGEKGIGAYLGEGRFAMLLPSTSATAARRLAEQIADDFSCRESHRDALARPTLSQSLTPWQIDLTPDTWLQTGLDTLLVAMHSGGGILLEPSDIRGELDAWQQEMTLGNPFASVLASDIMLVFPTLVRDDPAELVTLRALRRGGVDWIPVVDGEGKTRGVVQLHHDLEKGFPPLGQAATIAATATFAEVYDAFDEAGGSDLLVEAEGRPLGYLTCEAFTSLIEPVSPTSFQRAEAPYFDTRDLVVPRLAAATAV
jgi:GGDEF domain-containing protein